MITPQPPKEDKHELSDAQKAEIDEAVHVTIGKYGDTFKKLGDNDELALRSEIARICGLTPYRNQSSKSTETMMSSFSTIGSRKSTAFFNQP